MAIKGKKLEERHQIIDSLNRLHPGDVLDVQFDSAGKVRLKCRLMGFDETKYLALSTPPNAVKGYETILLAEKSCIVRAIVEGDAGQCLAFKSKINAVTKKPYPLIFIDYPTSIELYALRKEQRLTTHVPAVVSSAASKEQLKEGEYFEYNGVILDLSTGGCRLSIPWVDSIEAFTLKTIFIHIQFPSRPNNPLIVEGEVKGKSLYKGSLNLGVKFELVPELIELFTRLGLREDL